MAGFFSHTARKDPQEGYRTLIEGTPVFIHPSSAVWQKNPDWIIYHELVQTTKEYMREVCVIDPRWLVQVSLADIFRFFDFVFRFLICRRLVCTVRTKVLQAGRRASNVEAQKSRENRAVVQSLRAGSERVAVVQTQVLKLAENRDTSE